MKYIDNNYEYINKNEINFDIENHYKKMLDFMSKLGIKEELLLQMYYDSLSFIIQFTNGIEYKTKYNSNINNHKFLNYAGAFATFMEQEQSDVGFKIIPGICLRNRDIEKNVHIFTHESFHAFSEKTELPYDQNGINYAKSGLKVIYYNRNDEMVNNKYTPTGLNEGITELLTRNFLGETGNRNYLFQVVIAEILSNNDTSLFETYFSRNNQDVINFFTKFENTQNILSGQDLINMSPNIITDENIIYKYLEGAITYDLNIVDAEKKEEEITKIKNIVSELDKSLDYRLDNGSYLDMVNEIIIKLQSKHK